MRLRVDITIGPLRVLFDPWPEVEVEEEDEGEDDAPPGGPVHFDSTVERDEDRPIPELHIGFRGSED